MILSYMEKCEFHDMYIRSTVNLRTILYDIHSERSTVTIIIKDNSYEITMFIVLRDKPYIEEVLLDPSSNFTRYSKLSKY